GTGTNHGSGHDDLHDIVFDPNNSNIVFYCCDGGIFKSTTGGISWSGTALDNGLAATQFYGPIGVSATNANLIAGGLQDNGVWTYNGTTWTRALGGDGTACAIDPSNDNNMILSN